MVREANTQEPADAGPEAVAEAERLVGEADAILAEALPPGELPPDHVAEQFLFEGKLEQVLVRYLRAMRYDASESAYPWNLAAAVSRLGLNDLALGFMMRAIHLAEAAEEEQWSGPDAQIVLAEMAIEAGDFDLALTALAHAQALDEEDDRASQVKLLLQEIRDRQRDLQPQVSLADLLQKLPA